MAKSFRDYINGELPDNLVAKLEGALDLRDIFEAPINFGRITCSIDDYLVKAPQLMPLYDLLKQGNDEGYCFTTVFRPQNKDLVMLNYGLFKSQESQKYFALFFEGGVMSSEVIKTMENKLEINLDRSTIRNNPAIKKQIGDSFLLAGRYN